jgi:hypothetical protein
MGGERGEEVRKYVYGVNAPKLEGGYMELLADTSETFEGGIAVYGEKMGSREASEKGLIYLGEVEE